MIRDLKATPAVASADHPSHKTFKDTAGPQTALECSPWHLSRQGSSRAPGAGRAQSFIHTATQATNTKTGEGVAA